jgi:hypothetical protein
MIGLCDIYDGDGSLCPCCNRRYICSGDAALSEPERNAIAE